MILTSSSNGYLKLKCMNNKYQKSIKKAEVKDKKKLGKYIWRKAQIINAVIHCSTVAVAAVTTLIKSFQLKEYGTWAN